MIEVIVFGQLTDIVGRAPLQIDDVQDTHQLITVLQKRYPSLTQTPFLVAVDKEIVNTNTILSGNNKVALLPPFAGG